MARINSTTPNQNSKPEYAEVVFYSGTVYDLHFHMREQTAEVVILKDTGGLVTFLLSLKEFDYQFNKEHRIFRFLTEHILSTHYRILMVNDRPYFDEEKPLFKQATGKDVIIPERGKPYVITPEDINDDEEGIRPHN